MAGPAARRSWPTPRTRSSRRPSRDCTGNTFIDDEVLAGIGVTDLSGYRYGDGTEDDLELDIFL